MTKITEKELILVDILKNIGVSKQNTLKIMHTLRPKEEWRDILVDYIDSNRTATQEQILAKAMEIADTL